MWSDCSRKELDLRNSNITDGNGTTPLHITARNGNLEIFQILIGKVDDVGPKEKDGTTPLHITTQNCNIEFCKLIMERMEEVHPVSSVKMIPTDYGKMNGHTSTEKLIGKFQTHLTVVCNKSYLLE